MTTPGPSRKPSRHGARTPRVGARVTLRYRLPEGSVPSMSDALGTLVALAPTVRVRTADGSELDVAPERVVALKAIPPKPVRTSAIRALERAVATAPGAEAEWLAGWVARAPASTGPPAVDLLDAAAATPLADASMPEGDYFHDLFDAPTLERLEEWYSARGLPLTLRLPDRLVRPPRAWDTYGEHTLLVARLPLAPGDGSAPSGTEEPDAVTARLAEAPDGAVRALLTVPAGLRADSAEPAGYILESALAAACRRAHAAGATDAVLAVPGAADGAADDAADSTPAGDAGAGATERLGAAARAAGFAEHHRCRFVRPVRGGG